MHYVVALNGSVKVSDKAMTPDDIERTSTPVDRLYYLERVRKAMDNIFVPIYEQLAVRQAALACLACRWPTGPQPFAGRRPPLVSRLAQRPSPTLRCRSASSSPATLPP